ncbi:MAG: DNA polymerase III subunit gamma/tau, partial [Thiobacillaceae bacterium]
MSHLVLARKWRPRSFAEMVGQEHVVRALSNALTQGRLHHAYLFTGTRGVGKTTLARILAKCLNCATGLTATPCGVCPACQDIEAGRFVDLIEIDAASYTGVDNMREVLENAQYAPTAGRYKVYIIDEVHMLSKSAFNAMLKTLEEPPAHVVFVLATTDPQKVPVTVLSRCLQFNLKQLPPSRVAEHLKHVLDAEGVAFEAGALSLLARAAAGSMRDALSLTDQAIAYGGGRVTEAETAAMLGVIDQAYLYPLLEALADNDGPRLMQEARRIDERSLSLDAALQDLAVLLYQLSLAQTVPEAVAADTPERDRLFALARRLDAETVQLYYQIATLGRRDLEWAPDEFAGFSMTLLRMLAFAPEVDGPPTVERQQESGQGSSRRSPPPARTAA